MNEEIVRSILKDIIKEDNSLFDLGNYVAWEGGTEVILDGRFAAFELLAISWWMSNITVKPKATT